MPVILITGFGTMETAIGAIRSGAYDFIPKPFEIDQLVLSIERAMTLSRLKEEVQRLRRAVADAQTFGELLGGSPRMMALYGLLEKVSGVDTPVLVTGETGTGKELVAQALHRRGPRAKGPFVVVGCAALPEPQLERELFGAAASGDDGKGPPVPGAFVAAGGGTVFLDDIDELPPGLQPKLLRALQERAVRPVSGSAEVPFDARIITATPRDLETMVEEGKFREDLFFRINVIQVAVPPLRARGGDVLLLAQHFVEQFAARTNKRVIELSPAAAEKLLAYPWPGNVRELANSIERAVALASFDRIAVNDLPEKIRQHRSTHVIIGGDDPTELVSLEEMERRYVLRVHQSVGGNKSAAARILRIERKTLYRMLERWGIRSEDDG
jgi:two-component system response regulator HydG